MDNRDSAVGLCAHCVHCRPVHSARGATFYRCHRAMSEPAFPRYPRLPVEQCAGFVPIDNPTGPAAGVASMVRSPSGR